jgi:cell pole-organizing protein PopZ
MSDAKSPADLSMDEILQSIQRIIAEDDRSPAKRGDDILELTEAVNEDGTVRHLAPVGAAPRPREPATHEPIPPAPIPAPIIEPDDRPERPERPAAASPLRAERDKPVSAPATERMPADAAPPLRLPAEPRLTSEPLPHSSARSVDDLVAELLRPMLKSWLDEHLPPLVERLVRAEVAEAVEKSRGSKA